MYSSEKKYQQKKQQKKTNQTKQDKYHRVEYVPHFLFGFNL